MCELANQFCDFANSLDHGYLKQWKAQSMISTLHQIPTIGQDNTRLLTYLSNCLGIEGFGDYEIEKIQRWIIDNVL